MAVAYSAAAFVLRSGFGRTLVGIRENETRMSALGLPVWSYKAAAFGLSGAIAGLAGVIAAQHLMFVSPEMLAWTVSGEALVIVILGGLGTLAGPALGAAIFVFLKHQVSSMTDHWHMVIGVVLIVAVMSGGRGIFGQIEHYADRHAARRQARLDAAPAICPESAEQFGGQQPCLRRSGLANPSARLPPPIMCRCGWSKASGASFSARMAREDHVVQSPRRRLRPTSGHIRIGGVDVTHCRSMRGPGSVLPVPIRKTICSTS